MGSSEFSGKAVVVTGAAQGIGRTIAEQFLRQDARVLIFDLDAELATETARQLSPNGEMVVTSELRRKVVKLGKSIHLRKPFSLAFHHECSSDSPDQFIFLAYTFHVSIC